MFLPTLILTVALSFPIPQLGNCGSVQECKNYCDIPWHQTVCSKYARQTKATDEDVLGVADLNYPIAELDNCASREECRQYCDKSENFTACTEFAQENGLPHTRTVRNREESPLEKIAFPIAELGNCASREECEEYCNQPANRATCQAFAEEQGLARPRGSQPHEEEQPRGEEPGMELEFPIEELGNCASIDECDAFCRRPENKDKCSEYAKKTDMQEYYEEDFGEESTEEDHQGGQPPGISFPIAQLGNCGSMEECDLYCQQPDHQEQCIAFARQHGLNAPEQSQRPDDKSGLEERKEYCKNHPDDEACRRSREEYCKNHPEDCKKIAGPGGCTSKEECQRYCQQNPNDAECQKAREKFGKEPPKDSQKKEEKMPPKEGEMKTGPGGCNSPEECKKYCENNPDDPECKEMPEKEIPEEKEEMPEKSLEK